MFCNRKDQQNNIMLNLGIGDLYLYGREANVNRNHPLRQTPMSVLVYDWVF